MNTILIIEPRILENFENVINRFYNLLDKNWIIVFYCGKNAYEHWNGILDKKMNIEYRLLDHDNFPNAAIYNDFCKQKSLWESLYGKFVLTVQADCWILNNEPYTIDHFMGLDKSYIGGNLGYPWYGMYRKTIGTKCHAWYAKHTKTFFYSLLLHFSIKT